MSKPDKLCKLPDKLHLKKKVFLWNIALNWYIVYVEYIESCLHKFVHNFTPICPDDVTVW